jgi:hypothetical protein
MKTFYTHDGSAWKKVMSPAVHDGSSYKRATKIYCHDGTDWKLVYDAGYSYILSSGLFPGPDGGVVWSSGLAFVDFDSPGSSYVYHYNGTTTRLGSGFDQFITAPFGEIFSTIFQIDGVLLAYIDHSNDTVVKWTGSAWAALPDITSNGVTYAPGSWGTFSSSFYFARASRDRATQNTILWWSNSYYDYGTSRYKTDIFIYNASANTWTSTVISSTLPDGSQTIQWIHQMGGTTYALGNTALWSLSGSTWSKVCDTPATLSGPGWYYLTDDGSSLFLCGAFSFSTGVWKLVSGSFTSLSSTNFGGVGFGGKLWCRLEYHNGTAWTSWPLGGTGSSGLNTPFRSYVFIQDGSSYYVLNRDEPHAGDYDLLDVTDGSTRKSTGGPARGIYSYRVAQGGGKIYTLDFANSRVLEYDLTGQIAYW